MKPLAGILTDAFPLFGSRRRSYILISASLAGLSWIGLILTPHTYGAMLWVVIVINVFMVVTSTVVGGTMVEAAQAVQGSGRLTAIRQFVQQACVIVNGPTAGYLASIAFGWTAGACGGIMLLMVPVTLIFLQEKRRTIDSAQLLTNARQQLRNIAAARTMWAAAGLMALFYAAPGFGTAIFYKQQNDLHLDTHAQGYLALIGGIFGVLAALGYAYACRRLNLRILLFACVTIATVANLGYLFYASFARAQIIDGLNGFAYTLAELALMDLAVRATPAGSEGLGFSLMVSVRNLVLSGTDWFGSLLLDRYHLSFDTLVIANSVTTAIAIPLIFLLPRLLVERRDGGPPQPALVTRSEME